MKLWTTVKSSFRTRKVKVGGGTMLKRTPVKHTVRKLKPRKPKW
jgi:hypothetical protein